MSQPASPRRSIPSINSRELLEKLGCNRLSSADDLAMEAFELEIDHERDDQLLERYALLNVPHRFAPGMLVRWKPGLRNRRYPTADQSAVVLEVLEAPLLDTEAEPGSTYFREPLDLVLGVILTEGEGRGEFLQFYCDGRRFQPWPRRASDKGV